VYNAYNVESGGLERDLKTSLKINFYRTSSLNLASIHRSAYEAENIYLKSTYKESM
jgi:hypothetical protein